MPFYGCSWMLFFAFVSRLLLHPNWRSSNDIQQMTWPVRQMERIEELHAIEPQIQLLMPTSYMSFFSLTTNLNGWDVPLLHWPVELWLSIQGAWWSPLSSLSAGRAASWRSASLRWRTRLSSGSCALPCISTCKAWLERSPTANTWEWKQQNISPKLGRSCPKVCYRCHPFHQRHHHSGRKKVDWLAPPSIGLAWSSSRHPGRLYVWSEDPKLHNSSFSLFPVHPFVFCHIPLGSSHLVHTIRHLERIDNQEDFCWHCCCCHRCRFHWIRLFFVFVGLQEAQILMISMWIRVETKEQRNESAELLSRKQLPRWEWGLSCWWWSVGVNSPLQIKWLIFQRNRYVYSHCPPSGPADKPIHRPI